VSIDKTQRVALITGANRGIGRKTARQLARRGFHVVIAARDEAKGIETAGEIQAGGGSTTLDMRSRRRTTVRILLPRRKRIECVS
jgi:NAD(P)-dependent dehydrogenase (short-subunit alcohol dehydrogenase family)